MIFCIDKGKTICYIQFMKRRFKKVFIIIIIISFKRKEKKWEKKKLQALKQQL